ncbi:hypothetical protein B0H11DRAFT_1705386, partial [Mycena galericulata]
LPPELEREIFEIAIGSHRNPAFKLSLSLVARRVQLWVDVAFYEMVTIHSPEHAAKFLNLIDSNLKPPVFFAAVKILCLPFGVTATQACDILSVCTEVQLLACWVDHRTRPDPHDLPNLLGRLPLRRLSIEFGHFSRIPTTQSTWLLGLTHVDLVIWKDPLPETELFHLSRLPCLTHVALPVARTNSRHAVVVCASCPRLQVLVIIDDENYEPDKAPYLFDARIVVQVQPDFTEDWEAPYFGSPDMWSRAEDIIAQRKALEALGVDSH